MAFMIRYGDVVTDEMSRMRIARESRGGRARWLWQARATATSAGALFVRSYERGERVYLAMESRGYTGSMPSLRRRRRAGSVVRVPAPGGRGDDGCGVRLDGAVSTPAIHLSDVTFAYPDGHAALDSVDLTIACGERVAVLGPNGAGKTTLILHLNGIHTPQQGRVSIGGLPVAKPNLGEIRRRVGIVFQDPDDQLFMPTVRQDVAFGPANFGATGDDLDARVAAALGAVGMEDHADRAPHHLSFGERRRVALATVLSMDPDVLVLDEPSANLDPASRRELADILDGLDITIVLVTHDLPYALQLCPRSVVLDRGRVVADDDTAAILANESLLSAHRLELPFGFDGRLLDRA